MAIVVDQMGASRPTQTPTGSDSPGRIAAYTFLGMLLFLILLPILSALWRGLAGSTPREAAEALTLQSKLTIQGIGPIRFGMSVSAAADALGQPLRKDKDAAESEECYYVRPEGGPEGLSLMVIQERIVRADIDAPGISSRSGAQVGDAEMHVLELYGGRLQVQPHHYDKSGHYLAFYPKDSQDQGFAMVFETDGKVVTTLRAGSLPEVEYVEGCL